ncbi:Uma2 family endonuclease [bacterium]|nr:Uma2 family endonuclease [bacterium]
MQRPPSEAHDTLVYTYEDLADTPDDNRRYEIIDGELIVTPSPFLMHQRVARNIFRIVDAHVVKNDLGEVFFAPLDVVFSKTNVVEPDVIFVSAKNSSILERHVRGVPDLAVEVISKGTRKRDLETKLELYERFGVAHYWVLNPLTQELWEHVLRGKGYVRRSHLTGAKKFRPACFPGLVIDLRKVWAS